MCKVGEQTAPASKSDPEDEMKRCKCGGPRAWYAATTEGQRESEADSAECGAWRGSVSQPSDRDLNRSHQSDA